MGYKTTINLALIIISIVIGLTYVQPTFNEMKLTQDETAEYQEAIKNANSFTAELARLQGQLDRLNPADVAALAVYLPESVDAVAVMRDIKFIVESSLMSFEGVAAAAGDTALEPINVIGADDEEEDFSLRGAAEETELITHQFTLTVTGSYTQLKSLLEAFERNEYPLEVVELNFSAGEGSLLSYTLTLETYSLGVN